MLDWRLEVFPLPTPTFYISQHKVEFELVNVGRAHWQHGVRMNINFGWIVTSTSGSMDSHSKCSKLAI